MGETMTEATEHETGAPEPPPRGVRAVAVVRWVALALVTALAATTLWQTWGPRVHVHDVHTSEVARYHCPMHPAVTSPTPGECPICHMTLVPNAVHAPVSPPLAPVTPSLTGLATVQLSAERQNMGGIVTVAVVRRSVENTLRAPAVVTAPEQNLAEVHVRTPGFIEREVVQATGARVGRGEILAYDYSPEIYQTEVELLSAHRLAHEGNPSAMELAARQSLLLRGLTEGDIDAVVHAGAPQRAVAIRAPREGYITRRAAVLGAYVTPDTILYEITGLGHVWIEALVDPAELRRVRVGRSARFEGPTVPSGGIDARVSLIEPSVTDDTRTARVRLEATNPQMALRPGEYGEVTFAFDRVPAVLVVPRDAVIDTGDRQYVYVADRGGQFAPRRVQVGALAGDDRVILDGLRDGDRVVARGGFMIDSESRLRASLDARETAADGGQTASSGPGPDCATDFDGQRYPVAHAACQRCEQMPPGMEAMVVDCKNAIPRPWR